MKTPAALKIVTAYVASAAASSAFAHDGHGMAGSHWHSTDAWGFVALGLFLALAVWLSRGDK